MGFRKHFSASTKSIALHLSWCARPLCQAVNRGLEKLWSLRWEIRTHPSGKEETHGARRK